MVKDFSSKIYLILQFNSSVMNQIILSRDAYLTWDSVPGLHQRGNRRHHLSKHTQLNMLIYVHFMNGKHMSYNQNNDTNCNLYIIT